MKAKTRRTLIYCDLYHITYFAQRGGDEQSAVDWYTNKMKSPKHALDSPNSRQGHFTYNVNERDALFWFRRSAGAGTIAHEVHHAIVRLSVLLNAPINEQTDEIFAHYSGWLSEQIVRRLW